MSYLDRCDVHALAVMEVVVLGHIMDQSFNADQLVFLGKCYAITQMRFHARVHAIQIVDAEFTELVDQNEFL